MWSAQLIRSKPYRIMNKAGKTAGDWEPFSELVETLIHPLLINIVPPFVNQINPMFHFLQFKEVSLEWLGSSSVNKTGKPLATKLYTFLVL